MTGDCIAQHAFERRQVREHDYKRSARMGVYGGLGEDKSALLIYCLCDILSHSLLSFLSVFAPLMHVWFGLVGRIQHINKVVQTVARVVVDQSIAGPIFPGLFYTCITLLEGGSLQDARTKVKSAWPDTWMTGVLVFTPASVVNMSMIAPPNRVLFMNAVGLSWNIYLSHANNRHKNIISGFQAAAEDEGRQQ
jgi:protein Mpv17